MLLQFKNGADEEECPLPDEIRDELLEFHTDLLAHCGKEQLPTASSPPPTPLSVRCTEFSARPCHFKLLGKREAGVAGDCSPHVVS